MNHKSINLVLGVIILLILPHTGYAGLPGDTNGDGIVILTEVKSGIDAFLGTLPANTISINPVGNGSYAIQGSNLNNVTGLELVLSYDSAALSQPAINPGELAAGASMAANTDVPGTIRVTVGKPLTGSGQLAVVSFASLPRWFSIVSVKPVTVNAGVPGDRNGDGAVATTELQSVINAFNGRITANTVSIIPAGNGSYIIQGSNLSGVSGIELALSYDSTIGSLPTVTPGGLVSGAIMEYGTKIPGTIVIAALSLTSPFSGSGPIAVVSFASVPRWFSIALAEMVDNNGEVVP